MTSDPNDDPRAAAVEQLQEFGLSAYAARTFVALTSLGTATAKDVSRVADVPRTRVYDAVEELRDHGLVDVQQSSPREFWAVSAETAARRFEQERRHRISVFLDAVESLGPAERREEQRGVWTVTGETTVTDRVLEFIRDADDEVVYMSVGDLLTDDIVDALEDAADRGVTIRLGAMSPDVRERIQETVPSADVFDSLWVWSDTPAGRLILVDREQTLVSVLVNGPEAEAEHRSETAIWGSGETNSLVVVLQAIFTWQLTDGEDGDD